VDEAIRAYYGGGVEIGRLERGYWRLELERTKELLGRYLPPAPARVLDVGGGPGVYAEWLADAGYHVKLIDLVSLYVEHAQRRAAGRFDAEEGDARSLGEPDNAYAVVLLLGPLYHLVERADRLRALREARRVLRERGLLAAADIEGPAWLRMESLDESEGFETAMRVARAVETAPAVIGTSAHLLAVARRT
jgi:SAM-dependent methyltransferase